MHISLGLIGTGSMGSALAERMVTSGFLNPKFLTVYDIDEDKARGLSDRLGCNLAPTVEALAETADALLLAIKPYQMDSVLRGLDGVLNSSHFFISIAAGITIAAIEGLVPEKAAVVRVMPNTPALVGSGVTALSFNSFVDPERQAWAQALFACVGAVLTVDEVYLDAVTAVSGSGPAYVYLFLEAMIDGAVTAGLSRSVAEELAVETVLGAARMVKETGTHPAELRAQVTSPGGTTAAGVRVLEREAVRSAVIEGILAAKERSLALGKK